LTWADDDVNKGRTAIGYVPPPGLLT
jgi:hypothetical protein